MTEEENNQKTQETAAGNNEKLEQVIVEKEREIKLLRAAEGELREQLKAVNRSLAEAVTGYKNRVIQLNPGITEDLISGETIEQIDQSLEKGLGLISRVKKSVENEISRTRVPAGAPGRKTTDLSALSPREKIQYAIGGKK